MPLSETPALPASRTTVDLLRPLRLVPTLRFPRLNTPRGSGLGGHNDPSKRAHPGTIMAI